MSHITDVLLCTAIDDGGNEDEHPNADMLSDYLVKSYGASCKLVLVSGMAGGKKAMCSNVFAVAVDCCNIPRLIHAFKSIPWEYPECAQLMVKNEEDDIYTMHTCKAD
jgi:hypothetical protein